MSFLEVCGCGLKSKTSLIIDYIDDTDQHEEERLKVALEERSSSCREVGLLATFILEG